MVCLLSSVFLLTVATHGGLNCCDPFCSSLLTLIQKQGHHYHHLFQPITVEVSCGPKICTKNVPTILQTFLATGHLDIYPLDFDAR